MLVLSLSDRSFSTSILFIVLTCSVLLQNLCGGSLNFLPQSLWYINFSVKQPDFFFFFNQDISTFFPSAAPKS